MATPLPLSPFLDPMKCDACTLMAHMLSELSYTVGIAVREIHRQRATQADMDMIIDTIRGAAMPRFLSDPSDDFLEACTRQ
jgi:hypothetical protein